MSENSISSFGLLKERRFFPFFVTQFFGAFNDNFLKSSLAILITYQSITVLGQEPAKMVPLLAGIFILPFFIFSAIAGQIADKYEKTKIIYWVKVAEIFFMVIAALGLYFHLFEVLVLVVFLMGTHSAFFGPVKYSILPQHLKTEGELISANALIEGSTFIAILLGTIFGNQLGSRYPMIAGFGLIFFAVVGWAACLKVPKAPAVAPELIIGLNPIPPTWRILKIISKDRLLLSSVAAISWFWMSGAALLSLVPSYSKEVLQEPELTATKLLATFSIGIAIGSVLYSKLTRGKLQLVYIPLGSLGMSVACWDLYLNPTPFGFRVLFDFFAIAVSGGLFTVPLYTLVQERTEASYRSQAVAANNILNSFFIVIASVTLSALLGFGITIPELFGIISIANLVFLVGLCLALPVLVRELFKVIDPRKTRPVD